MAHTPDWTGGAAKWFAVSVLGAASILGLYWSITRRGSPTLPPIIRPQNAVPDNHGTALPPDAPHKARPEATPDDYPALNRLININKAGPGELELIPGIGPVLASRIVEDRNRNGPFATFEDLLRVPGIGERTLERMIPHITLD